MSVRPLATNEDILLLRRDMAKAKAEIIRWNFIFCIGTIITIWIGMFAILKLFFDK